MYTLELRIRSLFNAVMAIHKLTGRARKNTVKFLQLPLTWYVAHVLLYPDKENKSLILHMIGDVADMRKRSFWTTDGHHVNICDHYELYTRDYVLF